MNEELTNLSVLVRNTVRGVFNVVNPATLSSERKQDGSWVTTVDHHLQEALGQVLLAAYPKTELLGEEMEEADQQALLETHDAAGLWILDPLDGTTNFIHGVPIYATSLVLVCDGKPRMAVTYDPLRDECFSAGAGMGAWLNGQPLNSHQGDVGGAKQLKDALAVVDQKRLPMDMKQRLGQRSPFHSMRNFGSVAIEWCWLAAGRFDCYVHGGQKLWDRLPGLLIHQEAGGSSCRFDGQPCDDIGLGSLDVMAANSPQMLERLREFIVAD